MEKSKFIGVEKHEYCPFIREKTEELLKDLLKQNNPKNILEIGTFLGYSASVILSTCTESRLITIEKDKQNFLDAQQNLKDYLDRVEIINCDAIDFLEKNDKKFDFIFLDGAKGQYIKYLPFLKSCLNCGGVLFADDVLFYSLVNSNAKIVHKHRSLVNNLRKFLQELESDKDFETQIFDFDDGVSISKKISR